MSAYLKAVVAFVVAVALGAVAQGLIVGAQAAWVSVVVGALASVGVYVTPNRQ